MKNSKDEHPHSTSWGPVTSWYDQYVGQEGSHFHQSIILPGVKKLLHINPTNEENFSIIDLACGQGVLQRYLTPSKMTQVGIDLSPELIQLAKERNTNPKIRYFQGDVTQLLAPDGTLQYGLSKHSFDAATIILAIQNITPLTAVWKAVYELLKPHGCVIIVMMHPSFRIPQSSDWHWNDNEHRQERILWNYLTSHEISIAANPGKAPNGSKTIHFHRPLQAYINTLGNASLYVDHIEEWVSHVDEQKSSKSEAIMKAKKEFPMFLAIRARKIS